MRGSVRRLARSPRQARLEQALEALGELSQYPSHVSHRHEQRSKDEKSASWITRPDLFAFSISLDRRTPV